MAPKVEPDSGLLEFVKVALQQKELSGICEMLKAAAHAMEAWGVFLWQLHEDSRPDADPPTGSLFVLAEWFPTRKTWAFEDLQLDTLSGTAVLRHEIRTEDDAPGNPEFGRNYRSWVADHNICCACSVPVDFQDARAALTFYRNQPRPFTPEEQQRAEKLAVLFPSLYQSIRNQVSFDLLREIERQTLENHRLEETVIDRTLSDVVALIGSTFKSFDCSLFLENRVSAPGIFRRIATTWPASMRYQTPEYRPSATGITPWILQNGKPVRFSNMAQFKPGVEIDPVKYPGMVWQDPLNVAQSISETLNIPREELPPLGYMAAPILASGRVVGAIRCFFAKEPPYYYAERELKLLQVAASDIGHYWDSWMRHLELHAEARAWRLYIDKVRTLNERVNDIMASALPDEAAIEEQFRVASEEAGAEAMRALLEQQKKLYTLLFQMLRTRVETENKRQTQAEAERRFYEDLFHQLKSPIFTAAATSRAALGRERTLDVYHSHLLILRAQLLKAERVTRAVQVFAELAKDREPIPELTPLDIPGLIRSLAWAAEDHERLFETKKLKFVLERAGLAAVRNRAVSADLNLIMNALNNLLDNAGKYSYSNGTVRIFGGLSGNGRFHISVANKGLRLRPGESTECLQRGWRGKEAQMVTGEGSGLGLWIVDRIMRAHNGQVLVLSPNSEDEFEIKLLFHYVK